MKNVIVFAAANGRYAVELRWVKDVIVLGFVTDVPLAPPLIAGIVNHRGALLPVLGARALDGGANTVSARQGDGAIILEVDELLAALRIDNVDAVCTANEGTAPHTIVDEQDRVVPLIDPDAMLRGARAAVEGVRPDAYADGEAP